MDWSIRRGEFYPGDGLTGPLERYKWTGDIRRPKKGEYFLSGAVVTAYEAFNDMGAAYHIAIQVKTELVEVEVK